MAWTWLYSSSYNFGGYKEYRAFLGYDQANYASYSRCWWSIGVQMKYASQYGVTAIASGAASGSCEGYLSSSPGGTWKDVCKKDGYFDVTRTTSKQTKTVTSTAKGKTVNGMGSAGGSGVSKSYTYTIPALASYTIKYDANGGSGAPGSQTKYYGKVLVLSKTTPSKPGYSFQGWSLTRGGSIYYYPEGNCYRNENLTLYAVWKQNTYTISYNGNGSTSGSVSSDVKNYEETAIIKDNGNNGFKKTNYRFVNWKSSKGITYSPGDTYTYKTNMTLYAQWEYYATNIIYNLNGGTGTTPSNQEIEVGSSDIALAQSTNIIPPTNKYFIEWNTSKDGSGVSYAAGAKFKSEVANDNFILYAIYKDNYELPKVTYTIKRIDANGKDSIGGKDLILSFQCQKAIGSNGIKQATETYALNYTTDGTHWSLYNNITGNINEEEIISVGPITNIDLLGYKGFKVVIPYSIQGVVDDESKTISGNAEFEISIPERENNQQFVTITNFSAKRKSPTDSKIVISFNWVPYYDGHEYYYYKTTFNMNKMITGNNEPSPITFNSNAQGGTIIYEEVTLNLENSAQISFDNAASKRSEQEAPVLSDLSDISSIMVGEGGLPVHINSTGAGISLFGVATNELSGFEINGPTTLNDTFNVTGATTINNTLNINTVDKYGMFINNTNNTDSGIKITRSDKDYHLFVGIGTQGTNHGIWSEAASPGWIINKDSTTGKIYANNGQILLNSNNILLTSPGVYMNGGQDLYFKNGTVLEQMLGVVLVWSHIIPGSGGTSAQPKDWGWQYTFIPKWHVQYHGGQGIYVKLQAADSTTDTYKYVYLYNNHIKGHSVNTNSGTGYDNRLACLRAVIGV